MPRNPNKIDYSGNFPEGFEIFSEISDPRGDGRAWKASSWRSARALPAKVRPGASGGYYMSSLKKERTEEMQGYIRGHRGIENGSHWVLDTLFREDHNQPRQRNAAKNLGTLRRIALNALKSAPDHSKRQRKRASSLTRKQLRAIHGETQLEEILSLV